MRFIITESKREKYFFLWLTNNYGDAELIESDNDILFIKNGETVFTYNKKTKGPVIKHSIASELRSMFSFDYDETEDIFDKWFSENFNLKVDFNRKDYVRKWAENQKSKIKTYNEFFGLKKPKNSNVGNNINVDFIKDQIVGDLTREYDLSDINKDVMKRGVDRFAQDWYNDVKNLDYDSAIYRTLYISETDDWNEFLGEIEY